MKDGEARCGLMVVDLTTGAIVHWVRIEGQITELYDVQVLPGVKRPMALGFKTEEIAQLIALEPIDAIEQVDREQIELATDDFAPNLEATKAKLSDPAADGAKWAAGDAPALWNRSRALKQQGKLKEAEACLREAIESDTPGKAGGLISVTASKAGVLAGSLWSSP